MSEESDQSKLRRAMIGTYAIIYGITTVCVAVIFFDNEWNVWSYITLICAYIAVYFWSKDAVDDFRKNVFNYDKILIDATREKKSIEHFKINRVLLTLFLTWFSLTITTIYFAKSSNFVYFCIAVPMGLAFGYGLARLITSFKYVPKEQHDLDEKRMDMDNDALLQSIDDYYYGIFPIRYHEHQQFSDSAADFTTYQTYDPNRPGGH